MPLRGTLFNTDSELLSAQEDSCLRETGTRKPRGKEYRKNLFSHILYNVLYFQSEAFFLTQLNYFPLSCFLPEFKGLEIGKINLKNSRR